MDGISRWGLGYRTVGCCGRSYVAANGFWSPGVCDWVERKGCVALRLTRVQGKVDGLWVVVGALRNCRIDAIFEANGWGSDVREWVGTGRDCGRCDWWWKFVGRGRFGVW